MKESIRQAIDEARKQYEEANPAEGRERKKQERLEKMRAYMLTYPSAAKEKQAAGKN